MPNEYHSDLCTSISEDGTHCELKPGHDRTTASVRIPSRITGSCSWKFPVSPWNRPLEPVLVKKEK